MHMRAIRRCRESLRRMHRDATQIKHRIQGKQPVHFLHIGKTGGSAVKHALRPCLVSDRYAIYLHGHDCRLRDIPARERVFFFLRDPVSRFVSGYYSRQRRGRPCHFSPWSSGERAAFGYFDTANQLAVSLSSRAGNRRERARWAMSTIAHVRTSFWDWFESEEYFQSRRSDVLLIGFQETLSRDFEVLKSRLGLPGSVALPEDDSQAHRNPKDIDVTLEETAVANLRRWYAEDYRFIELCREAMPSCQGAASPTP